MQFSTSLRQVALKSMLVFLSYLFVPNLFAQWEYVGSLHARVTRAITFIDAQTSVIVGGVQSTNMIARYKQQGIALDAYSDFDTTNLRFTDVSFPNHSNIGYVVGWNGAILKTVTSSDKWYYLKRYLPSSVTGRDFNGVYFTDAFIGYVVGGQYNSNGNDSIQTILKTTDGGNSWSILRDVAGKMLTSIVLLNNTTGFAIGNGGTILNTTNGGTTWTGVSIPGNPGTRDYRKIIFLNSLIGFIVGGVENSNVATILKTTDGGNTWSTIIDIPNSQILNGVGFKDANTGFVVGNKGIIKMSSDLGNNWADFSLPDSINDTIRNLRSVSFFNKYTGAFGGDNGKYFVYKESLPQPPSVATGNAVVNTDNTVQLSGTVNTFNNKAKVVFEYGSTSDLGYILSAAADSISNNSYQNISATTATLAPGRYYFRLRASGEGGDSVGQINTFSIGIPVAQILNALVAPTNKVKLSGTINPNGGSPTTAVFQYGSTPTMENSITVPGGPFSGTTIQGVSVVTPALSNGFYYYRLKVSNSVGEDISDVQQFYIGPNPIPNFDFEFWDTDSVSMPKYWIVMSAFQDVSYDGSKALRVNASENKDGFGLAILGGVSDNGPTGGYPFGARPDSIVGHFKYNVSTDTPAVMILFLKKDGNLVGMQPFYIGDSTHHSSNGTFERLAFKINYSDATTVPDSMIIGILSSDAFFLGQPSLTNDVVVDNLSFVGASVEIPNGNFEDWNYLTVTNPIAWNTRNDILSTSVFRTTDAQHGQYAVLLRNKVDSAIVAAMNTAGNSNNNDWRPAFSISERFSELHGYYKYFPDGNYDTAVISIQVYKNGNNIGGGQLTCTDSIAEYTPFKVKINYFDPINTSNIPDSATISFRTVIYDQNGHYNNYGNSKLFIDNLSFDNLSTDDSLTVTGVKNNIFSIKSIKIYPNPAKDYIALELPQDDKIVNINILDINGKSVQLPSIENRYGGVVMLNTNDMPTGIYIVQIQTNNQTYMNKFIIER